MININKGYPLFFTIMKIYLTRHSQTLWNQEKRLQGRLDSPLTKQGKDNAKALCEYIKDKHFDAIYTSPILRAYQTAQLIFPHQTIIQEPLLMEMNFGDFEGCSISKLANEKLYYQLWHDPEHFTRIPHGESYEDVVERVNQFFQQIKKHDDQDNIFVVTHGMFFIVLLATMLGYTKKDFTKLNQRVVEGCSLTCVNYKNGKFHLEYYNECSYLPYVSHINYIK